jgi:hypothetical protein
MNLLHFRTKRSHKLFRTRAKKFPDGSAAAPMKLRENSMMLSDTAEITDHEILLAVPDPIISLACLLIPSHCDGILLLLLCSRLVSSVDPVPVHADDYPSGVVIGRRKYLASVLTSIHHRGFGQHT